MEELFKLFKEVCDTKDSPFNMLAIILYSDCSGAFVNYPENPKYEFHNLAEAMEVLLEYKNEINKQKCLCQRVEIN